MARFFLFLLCLAAFAAPTRADDVSAASRYASSISISDGPVSPLCSPPIRW